MIEINQSTDKILGLAVAADYGNGEAVIKETVEKLLANRQATGNGDADD